MLQQDLRKEERFPASMLPEEFRTVGVLIDQMETTATVIDASYSGFGFQISVPVEHFSLGSSLIIYPHGTKRALYGTVVYTKRVDGGTSRVGVKLKEAGQFSAYRLELTQIIAMVAKTSESEPVL